MLSRKELRRRNGVPAWLCGVPWWARAVLQVLVIPIYFPVYLWACGIREYIVDIAAIPDQIRTMREIDERIEAYLTETVE